MSRVEKLTAEFNKTKVETAWLILAITIILVNSTAYAEVRKEYYESGQLKAEGNLKDGKLEGPLKTYNPSGQLKAEGNFKDGKQEGITRIHSPSGQLQVEAYFMNGQLISKKKYDEDGNLESEQDYPTE